MKLNKTTLLILYAEIMPYNVICFKDFLQTTNGQIHVICWGNEKKLTPYQPPHINGVTYYDMKDFTRQKIRFFIDDIKPSLVYVSGRMEKLYLAAALYARRLGIPVIGSSDTQFYGDWKQYIYKVLTAVLWKRYFDYLIVPGLFQYEFARHIGYPREKILFPQYSADVDLYSKYFNQTQSTSNCKKRYILFVGRLEKIKGIDLLFDAFFKLKKAGQIDLDLLVVGKGQYESALRDKEGVKLVGFLDQVDIVSLLPQVRFFCLPSRREPWGLVIHEMAAAGVPIVTTTCCGAGAAFVKNGYNGFLIQPDNITELEQAILKITSLSTEEMTIFSSRSSELSKQINPSMWTASIMSVIRS